jgi:hypothetical protein
VSVYFVYRSHYEGPSGKHVRKLPGNSILDWFKSVWNDAKKAPDVEAWVNSTLGSDVYGFASIFEAAREESLRPPRTDDKLEEYLSEHLYVEGEMLYQPHALQVLTDDDEIELAYYFFDDHYLQEHLRRAVYLLHDDWRLPTLNGLDSHIPDIDTKEIHPPGTGSGTTFLVFLAFYDSSHLTDIEFHQPCRIDGVRLPQLGDYLRSSTPDKEWPFELRLLRSQIPSGETGEAGLQVAIERAARLPTLSISEQSTAENGLGTIEQAGAELEKVLKRIGNLNGGHDPSKSLISTSDHIAQMCLHVGDFFGKAPYHHWILFDDLWAGANAELAAGVLRYAKRWDVLSDD